MNSNTSKNYPVATDEIASILGFHKASSSHAHDDHAPEEKEATVAHLPVANLPVVGHEADLKEHKEHTDVEEISFENAKKEIGIKTMTKGGIFLTLVKNVLPYIVLALIGVFAYYFFFSKLDITKYFQKKQTVVVNTVKETALQTLEKQNIKEYTAWMQGFYFDISDASLLDPEADNSGNGLSNFQKYLLKLNPKAYSSAGLAMADSEALSKGINPLSGGSLTQDQKAVMEKYVDMEVVMNRLALATTNVAGAKVISNNAQSSFVPSLNFQAYNPYGTYEVPANSGIQQNQNSEFRKNVTPNPVQGASTNNVQKVSPKTGSTKVATIPVNDIGINGLEIDEAVPGSLNIPSINVTVPVIFTKSTKDFTKDLQSGVVHYPGTALPGYIGTSYISGHSSNYKWAKGDYNQVFATLNDIPDNTSFSITVTQKNGKKATMHYVVTRRQQYKPTDQAQFQNSDKSVVALSTCWPVGSTAKRLVVFGEMTQMDKE